MEKQDNIDIIINGSERNRARLQAVIDDVQKRTRVRNIDAEDVEKALDKITKHLDISHKALTGTRASVDLFAQHFPNAYDGRPTSTQFAAVYRANNWHVVDVWRGETRGTSSRTVEMSLSDTARQALAARFDRFAI